MKIEININSAYQEKTIVIESREIIDEQITIEVPDNISIELNSEKIDELVQNYLIENDYFDYGLISSHIHSVDDIDTFVDWELVQIEDKIIYYFTEKDQKLPFKESDLIFPEHILIP